MKMTLLSYASLLVIICFLIVPARAQFVPNPHIFEEYNFDFTGAGARARGMGGAYIAISDDVRGASWNPAGIYKFEKPVFGISFRSLGPRGTATTDNLVLRTPFSPTWIFPATKHDHSGSFNTVASFSFVAPVRIKGHQFVGTINYGSKSDEYESTRMDILRWQAQYVYYNPNWIDIFWYPTDLSLVTEMQGSISAVNVGFGTRFFKSISFGATVNIYSGRTTRHLVALETINHFPYQFNQTIRSRTSQDIIDSTRFSGFNLTLGFKQDGEKLDAGLVIRTPFNLNAKSGRSIYTITDFKGEDSLGDPVGEWLQAPYATDTIYFDNILTKYSMPMMISAGLSFQQTENLTIAAGVDYRRYSNRKVQYRDSLFLDPSGKGTEFFTEANPRWSNVFSFNAGTEYILHPFIGDIPIRFGLGVTPLPAPSREVLGEEKTSISYSISGGTGIRWSQISLDLAYTYRAWDRNVQVDLGGGGLYLPAEFKVRNHYFTFSFAGVF